MNFCYLLLSCSSKQIPKSCLSTFEQHLSWITALKNDSGRSWRGQLCLLKNRTRLKEPRQNSITPSIRPLFKHLDLESTLVVP